MDPEKPQKDADSSSSEMSIKKIHPKSKESVTNQPVNVLGLSEEGVVNLDDSLASSTSSDAPTEKPSAKPEIFKEAEVARREELRERHNNWEFVSLADSEEDEMPAIGFSDVSSVSSLNENDIAELDSPENRTFYPMVPVQHLDKKLPTLLNQRKEQQTKRKIPLESLISGEKIHKFVPVTLDDIELPPLDDDISDEDEVLDLRFVNYLNSQQLLKVLALPVERRKPSERKRSKHKRPEVLNWQFPPKSREEDERPELEVMKRLIGYSPSLDLDTVPSNARVFVLRDKIVNFRDKLFWRLDSVRSSNYPVLNLILTFYGIINLLVSGLFYSAARGYMKDLQREGYKPGLTYIIWYSGLLIPSTIYIWGYRFFNTQQKLTSDIWPIWPLEMSLERFYKFLLLWAYAISSGIFFLFYFLAVLNDSSNGNKLDVPAVSGIFGPFIITILAYFILKERFSFFQLITSCLVVVGFTIMVRPDFLFAFSYTGTNTYAIAFAFISMFARAVSLVILRSLRSVNRFLLFEAEGFIGGVVSAGLASVYLHFDAWPHWHHLLLFLLVSICAFLHKVTLYYGFRGEECSQAGVILSTELLALYYTQGDYNTIGYVGISFIILAFLLVTIRRFIIIKSKRYPQLKRFFVLF